MKDEKFIKDLYGFVVNGIRSGYSDSLIFGTIIHDMREWYENRHESWFSPRSSDFAKYLKGEKKKFADWQGSKLNLNKFLTVGDAVDDAMVDYFLNVLPPACHSGRCVQIGEPYSHDDDDRPMFATLLRAKKGDDWTYAGNIATPETEQCLYAS